MAMIMKRRWPRMHCVIATVAVGAAAVALTTSSSRAAIVYTDPVDITLPWAPFLPQPQPVPIDLDVNGDPEFSLTWEGLGGLGYGWFAYLQSTALHPDARILSYGPPYPGASFAYATGFETGETVGPSANDTPYAWLGEFFWYDEPPYGLFYNGDWADPNRVRILSAGLSFAMNGQQHFGWVRIAMDTGGITLMDWAYESTPGVSIPAGVPAPACLPALALGALAASRRRR